MPGVLLKSDKLNNFEARGEHGLPVYRSATQLRSLITQDKRILNLDSRTGISLPAKDKPAPKERYNDFSDTALEQKEPQELKELNSLSRHLAIPHINEVGDVIDWYSPIRGFVIPWRSATPAEQTEAKLQIEDFTQGIANLTKALATKDNVVGGVRVSQLLPHVPALPGYEHIFLVGPDKIPVLTFWGFKNPGELDRAPLHFLYPDQETDARTEELTPPEPSIPAEMVNTLVPPSLAEPEPKPEPLLHNEQPVPPAPTPEEPATDWKRWLWGALALLLLIGLLLFVLRACSIPIPFTGASGGNITLPSVTGTTPALPVTGTRTLPSNQMPSLPAPHTALNPITPSSSGLTSGAPGTASNALPGNNAPGAPEVMSKAGSASVPAIAPEHTTPPGLQPPLLPADSMVPSGANTGVPAAGSPDQGAQSTGSSLVIPPNATDNQTPDFLNGNWQASSGLQDSQTGLPIRLNYQFHNGQGKVMVNRGNGQECSAAVSAAMQQGVLGITPGGPANCTDGTTFVLPPVRCSPNGNADARCTGQYGDSQVPLAMKSLTP
ncbi:MAG: hypothetical protein GX049_06440 [Alcaligenaceae bacterium]|nr:hypothetical protein [Alcaligenaceae bacterium]